MEISSCRACIYSLLTPRPSRSKQPIFSLPCKWTHRYLKEYCIHLSIPRRPTLMLVSQLRSSFHRTARLWRGSIPIREVSLLFSSFEFDHFGPSQKIVLFKFSPDLAWLVQFGLVFRLLSLSCSWIVLKLEQ